MNCPQKRDPVAAMPRLLALFALLLGACASVDDMQPGSTFRDCVQCPEMLVVPAGQFEMGSPQGEEGRFEDEGPQHSVSIGRRFAVSRTPITRAQYDVFAQAVGRALSQGCMRMSDGGWVAGPELNWRDPGFEQSEDHPVVCVSWDDAKAYADWLTTETGAHYRLLSEAEFEYAARAGRAARFPWGEAPDDVCLHANGFDLSARREHPDWPSLECDDGAAYTSPVASYRANAFGLFDMTGNVFQWTQDCFAEGYTSAPVDGSANLSGDCRIRVIRGGSWLNGTRGLRSAMRDRDPRDGRYANIGIRVARDLGG